MNKQEFLNETHLYIDDIFEKFMQIKEIFVELLEVFDRICINNNLRYFTAWGESFRAN